MKIFALPLREKCALLAVAVFLAVCSWGYGSEVSVKMSALDFDKSVAPGGSCTVTFKYELLNDNDERDWYAGVTLLKQGDNSKRLLVSPEWGPRGKDVAGKTYSFRKAIKVSPDTETGLYDLRLEIYREKEDKKGWDHVKVLTEDGPLKNFTLGVVEVTNPQVPKR